MRRKRFKIWLGIGLAASGWSCGCAHEEHDIKASSPTYAARVYQTAPPKHEAPVPASPTPNVVIAEQAPADPAVAPPITTRAAITRGEPPPQRKSFTDVTAQPFFSHAQDYSWLQGQVEYSHFGNSWRIRYASVDE